MPPTNWSNPHSIATTQADNNLTDVALLQRYMSEVQHEVSRFDVKCDEILSHTLRSTPVSTPARGRGSGPGQGQQDAHSRADSAITQGQTRQPTPSFTTTSTPPSPAQPHTPVGPTTLPLDEISPTDTNFSLPSIFSSPAAYPRSSSPTSISSDSEPATCAVEDEAQDKFLHDDLPIGPLNPSAPHLIIMTSCLNCVLASLPCSRTLPSCTRCTRNGRLCLPQRKRVWQEIRNDGWRTEPMLVRGRERGRKSGG
ncbi:hypothetical protein GRF29_161g251461 [Pseudopithomyces chartarum]|uniref:Zn(2)-C6 fungal-type domain-containing protein n=1 Tax=Pseudopithomyces chartarum TaxID=1892770 RepID=A0AAN6LTZ6_9PLEO|nr:hypothetical protein GRF29_161g251461 [Pseudopithomyces chartarum]